jgi:hypothetical protein
MPRRKLELPSSPEENLLQKLKLSGRPNRLDVRKQPKMLKPKNLPKLMQPRELE